MGSQLSRTFCFNPFHDKKYNAQPMSPASSPIIQGLSDPLSPRPHFVSVLEEPLRELPFSSESRVDDVVLPPKPSSLCESCWDGPFAMRLGIPCGPLQEGKLRRQWPRSYWYTTSAAELERRAVSGCMWCTFLHALQAMPQDDESPSEQTNSSALVITVRGSVQLHPNWTPENIQQIKVFINNCDAFTGFVYTTSGKIVRMCAFLGWIVR